MTDYLEQKIDLNDPAIASVFDEMSYWSSRFGALLFQHIKLEKGLKALDVGCGTGFPILELANMHGNSCYFIGVDIWEQALSRAAIKLRAWGLKNVDLVRADGVHFPFPKAQFDLIVSHLGINNFENPRAILSECLRVAKPQARLVLTSNLKGHMQEFYDVYRQTLTNLSMHEHLERLTVNEEHRGTKESVCQMVEEAGFRLSKIIEGLWFSP